MPVDRGGGGATTTMTMDTAAAARTTVSSVRARFACAERQPASMPDEWHRTPSTPERSHCGVVHAKRAPRCRRTDRNGDNDDDDERRRTCTGKCSRHVRAHTRNIREQHVVHPRIWGAYMAGTLRRMMRWVCCSIVLPL